MSEDANNSETAPDTGSENASQDEAPTEMLVHHLWGEAVEALVYPRIIALPYALLPEVGILAALGHQRQAPPSHRLPDAPARLHDGSRGEASWDGVDGAAGAEA